MLNQVIKNNQYVFSANVLQNNFKDVKRFAKPYIFIITLADVIFLRLRIEN